MNLNENIHRIHQMMGIINENRVINIISELGLYDAIRYFGGYDKVKELIGDYEFSEEERIGFIRDAIKHLAEKHHSTGISTHELNMNPILYGISDDDEIQQIEYFNPDFATIDVYKDGYDNSYRSSFTEKYEYLDDEIFDKVFLFMVDALKHYK